MVVNWDNDKNLQLKKERDITFEQVLIAIETGGLLDILDHPSKEGYPDQVVFLVRVNDYVYAVPTVIKKEEFFLKTIYPSRKYTDLYLPGNRRKKYED
ncbi:MAG: toxin [Nitrospirae bacterium]|nr:MAG: toxin [Nitrospirota bacterium]